MTGSPELTKWTAHIDWWLMLPPGRPTEDHLAVCRPYLLAAESVLVLGSTPELRDLCHEERVGRVHVIDYSQAFHHHVSGQCIYKPDNEVVTFGLWQDELPKHVDAFDVILADLVSGNIPYKERQQFYQSIAGALRPQGIFVDRVLTNRVGYQDLNDLDRRYSKLPLNLKTVNDFANEYFFTSELTKNSGLVNAMDIHQVLATRFKYSARLSRLLVLSENVVPNHGVWYYGLDWSELEPTYNLAFHREATHSPVTSDPFLSRIETFVSSVPTEPESALSQGSDHHEV